MYVFGYPNKNVHLGIGIYKRVKSICCLCEGKQEDYRPWGEISAVRQGIYMV